MKKQLVILSAVAAVTAFAVPAMAETTLYGSARMAAFYNMVDNKGANAALGKTAGFDEHLQNNSRFGANFSNGDVGGKFELGLKNSETDKNAGYTRLLYGSYNFGSGKLTVGQDYNSYYTFTAQTHLDDNGLNGFGSLWDGRQAQIRVNMNNGLYVAAIQPTYNVANSNAQQAAATSKKLYMPKLNVGYAGKSGTISYNAGVVGQYFEDEIAKEKVTAALGYVNGKAVFGATSLLFNVSYAQNAGDMSFAGREAFSAATKKDARGFEGYVQLSQKLSDTLSANAGLGYVTDKRSGDKHADDKMAIFVNAPITLAKNVYITPEISYYDNMKSAANVDENKSYGVGAQFRIDF
ncbi:MAG: hypothetical protein FIA91_05570 [Geobacter sp.]|nr:hypothetical protein [Geobacter sp.]